MEKSLKNFEVVDLLNVGFAQCTAITLEPTHAYKVGKFRRIITSIYQSIQEEQKAIFKDLGIEDIGVFEAENKELFSLENPTEEQKTKQEERGKLIKTINAQIIELMSEDAKVEDVKSIPFEQWQLLRRENAEKEINDKKVNLIPNYIEDKLLGILWEEPTE